MYRGEFKNSARYYTDCRGYIIYIGCVDGIHYTLTENRDEVNQDSGNNLRNIIIKEIKTPKTITGYVNIDKDGTISTVFNSRIAADEEAYPDRTECVKVTITYTEGQFDN